MFEKYLQNIGLSDKEAAVYVALLSFEDASVAELAKKTEIKRPTVYVVLESLTKKGLISETQVGKKTRYQAEPPERLETYVDRQRVLLEEQSKRLKDVVPQLKSIRRESGERPVVKYYEGKEGVLSALEEFFDVAQGDDLAYLLFPKDLLTEIFDEKEQEKYRAKRKKKNIHSVTLYTSQTGDLPESPISTRMQVDGERYPITCDMGIYRDEVRINVLGKKLGSVYIKSPDIADTLRSLFRLAFDNLEKKKKSPRS